MSVILFDTSQKRLELRDVTIEVVPVNLNTAGKPMPGFWRDIRPTQEIIRSKQAEDSVSGGHYHRGEDPSKNPEELILCMGGTLLTLFWPDGKGLSVQINAASLNDLIRIQIPPLVWHQLKWTEPSFVEEIRTTVLDPYNDDTVRLTLEQYLAEMAKRREPVAA